MRIIYSPRHKRHKPSFEIFNGNQDAHAEVPDRIENIRMALVSNLGLEIDKPQHFPISEILAVHDRRYVDYLIKTKTELKENYVYPSVFPYELKMQPKIHPISERGRYSFDLYTPVNRRTFDVAKESVDCALTAARIVRSGKKHAYALCRPPGHHAEPARMGGYCYFNNAAIATHYLSRQGKVAVLDVDFHHGNGTQRIFYDRNDILTISIHADPLQKFPFFTGFVNEKGIGKGRGYNFNFPLPLKTTNERFQTTLEHAVSLIKKFNPRYLVVPVGYDTHEKDPIGGFALTTDYYRKMAMTIKNLDLPTVIIQEGGYNTTLLGKNAVSFVGGFLY